MKYRYDLHVHTKESSACARSTPAEMADMYKSEGFTGFVLTEHFYHGNTCVPRELEWTDWVEQFCQSYDHAKARGDEIGLDVFFGWEYSYSGTDFITLGLDKAWLLEHPEIRKINVYEYLNLVHASGGYIIHAHPYREAGYIPCIRLMPPYEDAVEVINAARDERCNNLGRLYAQAYDKVMTAGSDSHSAGWKTIAGIETDHRLADMNDLLDVLKSRSHTLFQYEREV